MAQFSTRQFHSRSSQCAMVREKDAIFCSKETKQKTSQNWKKEEAEEASAKEVRLRMHSGANEIGLVIVIALLLINV